MSATVTKTIDPKERLTVIDDLGLNNGETMKTEENKKETIDEDKLAALKAKLVEKAMEGNLPTKEEEETKELPTSLKFGVVGLGQAGCIDGGTNLYLSDYGIITIKEFFYNMLNESDLTNITVTNSNETNVSLQNRNIYTVSIDPETGELKKCKVTHVWKNRTYSKNKLTTENGTSLICSKKHPSLVFRPSSRRKAFFSSLSSSVSLCVGDRLFDTRLEVLDQLSNDTYVKGIRIIKDVAWLLGLFAGDGHNKLHGNEISFYCDNQNVVDKIYSVMEAANIPYTSMKTNAKPGCLQVCVYGLQARVFFDTAFEQMSLSTYGGFGNKTFTIGVPRCISAASAGVRVAFFAGLVDSDGTISRDWCETSVTTVSKKMSDQLGCLLSSIGARPSIQSNESNRSNEAVAYKIALSGKLNHGPLLDELIRNMAHSAKKEKLIYHVNNDQKSYTTSSVPILFEEMKVWMTEGGMTTVNHLKDESGIHVKTWAQGKQLLSIPSFKQAINSLNQTEQLKYIDCIFSKITKIKSIETIDDSECDFFDLTVEECENYVAGNNGLLFTHNSRVAETFFGFGYPTIIANTATQDLVHIKIPEENKLFMDIGLQGAAKNIERGQEAAEQYRDETQKLVYDILGSAQAIIVASSCGGGSGAGSLTTVIDLLQSVGKPIVVLGVLPMVSEDVKAKANSLETVSKIAGFVNEGKIHNFILVDNARIENIYSGVGQMEFFKVANRAIVDPIHVFNTYSMMPSDVKSLDSSEWATLLLNGEGLSVFGQLSLTNFSEDTSIAEGVISSLSDNLLASSFDLKQAKHVGFLVIANKDVWAKVPAGAVNYAGIVLNDLFGNPEGLFKGVYVSDDPDETVKIYTFVAGLGLPEVRLNALKKEVEIQQDLLKAKSKERSNKLNLDINKDTAVSDVEKLKSKIASKISGFGKLTNTIGVVDRRKR